MMEVMFWFSREVFNLYVLNRMIKLFLQRSTDKNKESIYIWVLYWIINGVLNNVFGMPWMNLTTSILFWLIMATVTYKGSAWKKVIAVFSTLSLTVACEEFVWILLNEYFTEINSNLLGSILAIFLLLMIEIIIERFCNLRREVILPNLNFIVMLAIPLGSIMVIEIIGKGNFTDDYRQLIGAITIIFINVFVFFLYDTTFQIYEEIWKKSILESQLLMYKNQFGLMKESQKRISAYRHDIKHHLMIIGDYAIHRNNEELLAYIGKSMDYIEVEKQYVKTGNEDIDCILNFMIGRAKNNEAEVVTKIKVPEEKFMQSIHLNIILSNLLENALEALARAEKKRLGIFLSYEKGIFHISIYNTYHGEIAVQKNYLLSSKRNYTERGIGLENINEVVKKYRGTIKTDYKQNIFRVDIIMFLNDIP